MKVLPKQYYLQIETVTSSDDPEFKLRTTDNLASILGEWKATTRISPVWRLRSEVWDERRDRPALPKCYEFVFISATNPSWLVENLDTGILKQLSPDDLWLTVGAYNLMVRCSNEDIVEAVTEAAEDAGKSLERWFVNGELDGCPKIEKTIPINPVEFSIAGTIDEKPAASLAFEKAEMPTDDTLAFMILEMFALTSVIETRSAAGYSAFKDDALGVQKIVAQLLPNGKPPSEHVDSFTDQKRRDLLLSLNAGLSRMASQALSGTTPITQTECHFWPHSLLGTGVANYALRNITQFLTDAVARCDYHNRYEANLLRSFPSDPDRFLDEEERTYQNKNYLSQKRKRIFEDDNLSPPLADHEVRDAALEFSPNPVTFFSGRDGFKNTLLTTSAPLMSVSGANCVRWNLGTISHEVSHRIISGKLGRLLTSLKAIVGDIGAFDGITQYLREEPVTNAEYCQKVLLTFFANKVFEVCEGQDNNQIKSNFVRLAKLHLQPTSREVEEILVHIFDFYHFYFGQADAYVEFVWHSWAVQPSIVQKLDEYILRTILALSSERFNDEPETGTSHDDCIAMAIGDFQRICSKPSFKEKIIPHLDLLERRLSDSTYLRRVSEQARRYAILVELFFAIFRQESLRDMCKSDSYSHSNVRTLELSPEVSGEPTNEQTDLNDAVDAQQETDQPETLDERLIIEGEPISFEQSKYKSVPYNYPARVRQFYSYKDSMPEGLFSNPLMFLRDFSRDDETDASKSAWLLTMLAFNWLPSTVESPPEETGDESENSAVFAEYAEKGAE